MTIDEFLHNYVSDKSILQGDIEQARHSLERLIEAEKRKNPYNRADVPEKRIAPLEHGQVTRQEFDELKARVESLEAVIRIAKIFS